MKKFENPEVVVEKLDVEDVITTSFGGKGDPDAGGFDEEE